MSFNFNWSAVSGGAPYVTISTISLAFNSVSIDKLGNPEKVIVGFDEEQCVIGVKSFTGEEKTKPYEFASRVKNGWIRIGCRDFIKYLSALTGIAFYPAKKYVAKYDNRENILYITVGDGGEDEENSNEE